MACQSAIEAKWPQISRYWINVSMPSDPIDDQTDEA